MYSREYINQLQKLHTDKKRINGFGGKVKNLGEFYFFMNKWNPNSLLDYGCGKGFILNYLKEKYSSINVKGYDPAVEEYQTIDGMFDCVFSNDVLEHVEMEYLDQVLAHIDSLSSKYIWLRIDTLPARKTLSDGRNAHLILQSQDWWYNKISLAFDQRNVIYKNLNSKGKLDFAIEN
jgi:2-polyprenyl-3-methyl-5-hydroxy-6-metoxy-1,4-benzoquinol methylase